MYFDIVENEFQLIYTFEEVANGTEEKANSCNIFLETKRRTKVLCLMKLTVI